MALILQVVVASHCANCEPVNSITSQLAKRFPKLTVEIIDLDNPDTVKPDAVFAVPTYLLEGRILWLGNPDPMMAVESLKEVIDGS